MTIAWNTACRASSDNPCCDWEDVARSSSTCCETENFLLKVTPSILIDWTRMKPEITGGGSYRDPLLLGLTKIISVDLARFSCRLFLLAQFSMLLSSDEHEWMFCAGMIKYVSSAYFAIKFVCETGCKSYAVMTYETGPTAEPWTDSSRWIPGRLSLPHQLDDSLIETTKLLTAVQTHASDFTADSIPRRINTVQFTEQLFQPYSNRLYKLATLV